MRVTLTGATGPIGRRLVEALRRRGDEVTVLSRRPEQAREALGVSALGWEPMSGPAPAAGLADRDAVVHLAGESVAQRWTEASRRRIHASRETGTRNLVAALRELAEGERPRVLASASGVDYYGAGGDEPVDESAPPGDSFLARVCVAWEREAQAAAALGLRVVIVRTGVVLSPNGGALQKMLPFFKLGVGGPVAGGRQYLPWVHIDDVVGLYVAAIDREAWSGPVNGSAPEPVTNKEFSRRLGRALRRPAFAPVPALAVRLLYGDMAEIVTGGRRAVPKRPLELGYAFRHAGLDEALRDALR
jgi:uncharacterized protein (TIGR01777 family)